MEKNLKVGDIVTSIYGWIGIVSKPIQDMNSVECKPAINECSHFLKHGYLTDPRPSTKEEIAKFNKATKKYGYFYKSELMKFSDEI